MNAQTIAMLPTRGKLMSGADYRESLRRYRPTVYLDGRLIESVADSAELQPGINALAVTYDFALDAAKGTADDRVQASRGRTVNRMLHINESAGDLLNKLEAVRILCQETGCAQRYLAHDALNAIHQVSAASTTRAAATNIGRASRLTSRGAGQRPGARNRHDRRQGRPLAATASAGEPQHLRAHRRAPRTGIVISGTKAIVTGAPYMHEFLVMPSRNMGPADADFAVCCALPVDAPGLTIVARPAGRPGEKLEHGAALFSRRYGQSTAVLVFDRVFVPWERVFFAGEWEHSGR
jgi:4-hydroxybutyryl-CoA dehydratase/vinylacetyl-CoA-Delta-isomerase